MLIYKIFIKMKTKIVETLTKNLVCYGSNTDYFCICFEAVEKILGLVPVPETIRVTASLRPFKGAKSIWLKRGEAFGSTYESCWTWKKRQSISNMGNFAGLMSGAQSGIKELISEKKLKTVSSKNPIRIYFKFESLDT